MNRNLHPILEKHLSRGRGWLLLLLLIVAAGMLLPAQSPPAAPAESADTELPLSGFVVALDPGHGGYDGGARAHDSGLWEKELTLKIALVVEEHLTKRGATVLLTRREDICLAEGDTATKARKRADLQKRVDMALEGGADVFLSIHLNEYRSRSESGPQVFYQQGGDDGRLLAGVLQSHMIRVLEPKKQRSAMAGDYYVLRSRLPSALVECGFLSNAAEEKLLLSPEYHQKIGQAIGDALVEYRQLTARQTQ